jgi:hypothetical protein
VVQRRFRKQARGRRDVLTAHAEEMVARIRFHVKGCAPCLDVLCGEGLPSFLARIDEELRLVREKIAAAPASGARPVRKRPRARKAH